jgi:hypothetical protein
LDFINFLLAISIYILAKSRFELVIFREALGVAFRHPRRSYHSDLIILPTSIRHPPPQDREQEADLIAKGALAAFIYFGGFYTMISATMCNIMG